MSFIGGNSAGYTALTVAERARQERQAREIERQAREQQEAQIAAAKVILRVWKRCGKREKLRGREG